MIRLLRTLFGAAVRATAVAVGLAAVAWLFLPWPLTLRWNDPDRTSVMRYRLSEARAADAPLELRHSWVPLDRIAPSMVRAVLTAEDGKFREHGGVDWEALGEELEYDGEPPFSWTDTEDLAAVIRAIRFGLTHRDQVRGRSTITQQLAKNLYFTPERSLLRKVAELFVAQRLEWVLSKDRILELYLNTVELGPGLFGVEAAAQAYFGVSASELNRYQAASLAGTLPHPLTSNPDRNPGRMAWRRDLILRYMDGGGGAPRIPDAPPEIAPPELDPPVLVDPVVPVIDTLVGEPTSEEPDTVPPDTLSPAPPPADTFPSDRSRP